VRRLSSRIKAKVRHALGNNVRGKLLATTGGSGLNRLFVELFHPAPWLWSSTSASLRP
jgi:hypothetical protein